VSRREKYKKEKVPQWFKGEKTPSNKTNFVTTKRLGCKPHANNFVFLEGHRNDIKTQNVWGESVLLFAVSVPSPYQLFGARGSGYLAPSSVLLLQKLQSHILSVATWFTSLWVKYWSCMRECEWLERAIPPLAKKPDQTSRVAVICVSSK
jgi:hypothetical protein